MARKIHIGPNGPRPCNVVPDGRPCPYDPRSTGENHFDSVKEAQAAYETRMESEHGLVSTVVSSPSAVSSETMDPLDYLDSLIEKWRVGRPDTDSNSPGDNEGK